VRGPEFQRRFALGAVLGAIVDAGDAGFVAADVVNATSMMCGGIPNSAMSVAHVRLHQKITLLSVNNFKL
jgi:hypothetical protein